MSITLVAKINPPMNKYIQKQESYCKWYVQMHSNSRNAYKFNPFSNYSLMTKLQKEVHAMYLESFSNYFSFHYCKIAYN